MAKRWVGWQSMTCLVFTLLASLFFSANAHSTVTSSNAFRNVSPSDVYRVVDDVYAELLLMQAANFSTLPPIQTRSIRNRFPRHVFQKGREVFIKVQQLRYINGLSVNEVPAIPTQQVMPKNVKVMMEHILQDIRDLRSAYAVMKEIEPAAKVSGKSPTKVYENISRVNALVSSLNIPSIVPNDVYRLITTVNNVIRDILTTQKVTVAGISISPSENKQPKDVFQETLKLISQVNGLCQLKDIFCISGGVVAPIQLSGRIRPAEVLELMNNLLADVVQIKINLGDQSANPLAPDPSGKTPSNVFDEVSRARALIRLLDQSEPVGRAVSQSK